MSIVSKSSKPGPVVLLFGPTAVGKSEIIAKLLDSHYEIINADSLQVYKFLQIGAAKPSPEELARLPHHLIDFLSPAAHFTAGDFIRRAEECIRQVQARGRVPVVSGGTAFYLKSLLFGLPDLPGKSREVRGELEAELARRGSAALHAELHRVDPDYAARISPSDRSRIMRGLEVFRLSGRPLSSFKLPSEWRRDFHFLLIGLRRPREELYRRINRRVEEMFRRGLVDEVRDLIRRGFTARDPGLKGIGYREFFEMQRSCLTLAQVQALIQQNSRHYAKRQLTFFRAFEPVHWFEPGETKKLRLCLETCLAENFSGRH